MNAIVIDFETTGFDKNSDRVTEAAARGIRFISPGEILVDNGYASQLCWEEDYPLIPEKVQQITGITNEKLESEGAYFGDFIGAMYHANGGWPDYFIAHNAPFDKGFFEQEVKRVRDTMEHLKDMDKVEICNKALDIPWLCSLRDIRHPVEFKSKKLAHLALDYGCAVDPKELHRALADVDLLIYMLREGKIDLAEVAGLSKIPDVIIRAIVPKPFGVNGDNGVGKDKAKACGFGYGCAPGTDGPRVEQAWLKKVKETDVEKEKEALGYEVKIIET